MDKSLKFQRKACTRCGVCCLLGPCGYSDDFEGLGRCRHLSFNEQGIATCGIYEKITKLNPEFTNGCWLKGVPGFYEDAKLLAEAKIGRRITGRNELWVSICHYWLFTEFWQSVRSVLLSMSHWLGIRTARRN